MKDYPGLSGWIVNACNQMHHFKREAEGDLVQTQKIRQQGVRISGHLLLPKTSKKTFGQNTLNLVQITWTLLFFFVL